METVFIVIAATLAAVLIWQVSPAGFNKLTDLDANLPTFTSVFGKLGFPILIGVGFIEFFVPALLFIDILSTRDFVEVFAGIIAAVMFGAVAVHTAVWKNSPRKPLLLLITTLLIAVFNTAAATSTIATESVSSVLPDTVQVDSIIADTVSQ
jgi:hypothetical protein